MILVSGMANANIHIDGKVATTIIKEYIDEAHRNAASIEYNAQLDATGNYTMSGAGLYKVCIAAGWDIATTDGKAKCDKFVEALIEKSDYKYLEVCGKDKGKSGGKEYCIDNVFGGIQVTMLQADGLCKEYARVKYNDDIECSTNTRKGMINPLNDYVKCTSKLKPIYYEFKFDDVVESSDKTVLKGVLKGVGKLYNVDISDPGCTVERMINDTACSIGYKTTDINVCNQINNSLKTFGYTSKVENVSRAGLNSEKLCGVHNITMTSANLKTAYGIPNDVFYDGIIQMQGSKDIKDGIKQYVTEKIKPEKLTSFECISNTIKMPSIKGKKDNDDVLTCYVNGNQIDFVFDDLSEAVKLQRNGGKEGFQCIINGGTFTGKRCVSLNEEQCKKIAESTFLTADCPECSKVYWDGNICTLPNAQAANALQKGLNIAMIVGGMVMNVVVTVGTGGTSTAVGGGLLFVETVGSAIELGTEIKMDLAADEFFVESAGCRDKNCAKDLIKKHLQRLSNFYSRLTGTEEKAIDKEMARLFRLIPAEELFSVEALIQVDKETGGKKLTSVNDNQKGFFDSKSWEREQIWQAVGITMQFTGLAYQIWNKLFSKSNKTAKVMTEVADVLDDKADEAMRAMARNSNDVVGTLNVIDRSKLSAVDQEFYDLWKAYAPKDQSFEAFKAMSGGDIVKMREMTKSMKAWNMDDVFRIEQGDFERLYKARPDIENYIGIHGFDDAADKFPEVRAILDRSNSRQIAGRMSYNFEKMLDEYTELSENYRKGCGGDAKCLEEGAKKLKEMREVMDNTDGFWAYVESSATGNYSTYNRNLSGVMAQKDQNIKDAQMLKNASKDGTERALYRRELANQLETANINNTIIEMETTAPMTNLDEVALERANQMKEIIDGNPRFQQLQRNYANLSADERVRFAQELSDELLNANKIGVDIAPLVNSADYSKSSDLGMFVSSKTDRFKTRMELDPNKLESFDDFVRTVSHEIGGHAVEQFNPNLTAVGAQRAHVGTGMIADDYELYRMEATEQSAYKVGDAVQQAFKPASVLDNSDEAGRIRIQAMKEKYDIHLLEDGDLFSFPPNLEEIMKTELGNSDVEKKFYEDLMEAANDYLNIDYSSPY